MKKLFTKTLFVTLFPLMVFGILADVIIREGWSALKMIYLELRVEFGSVRGAWRRLG